MTLEGEQIGPYMLQSLLGCGNIGDVYLAEDKRSFPLLEVAIKLVRKETDSTLSEQARDAARLFQYQMKAAMSLRHPNILELSDLDEGTINAITFRYVVMPYHEKGSLVNWPNQLYSQSPVDMLSLRDILHLIRQAASALKYAHDRQVFHLNVKPSNFLICYQESNLHCPKLLLMDFGFAKFDMATVIAGQKVFGTPAYIAPEQWEGYPVAATDQYALAIMTYQLLTGISPFQGDKKQIMYQHLNRVPLPPSTFNLRIPEAVDEVILRALAKTPEDRYPSILAFAKALEQTQYTTTSRSASPRKLSRRKVVVSLAGLSILAAGGGIGWWLRLVPHMLYTYHGHTDEVLRVAWSPDGKRIASGSGDKTVQVWDAADGGNAFTYRGHTSSVWGVVWSPHGTRIASGGEDSTVQVWDASDGGHVFTYRGHSQVVYAVAWSPDGRRIASASQDGTVQVWDADSGRHIFTCQGVESVAWSPDGKYIASSGGVTLGSGPVRVWDATEGHLVYTYSGHHSGVQSIAWSPDSKRIASVANLDKTVHVWNATDGSHPYIYQGHTDDIWEVAWSPNGKRIASASDDGTVQVWDVIDEVHVYTYYGHESFVKAVAWSPDGTRIASGSFDKTVQVWQAP